LINIKGKNTFKTISNFAKVAMVLSDSGSTVRILQLIEKLRFYEKSITVWRSVAGILHQIRFISKEIVIKI